MTGLPVGPTGCEPPVTDMVVSMTNGCSGCMLWINCSTGIVAGCGVPDCAVSGLLIGIPELEVKNLSGNLSEGTGAPTGMGSTNSGVTMTISSVLALVF